ncbi:phage terminase small subunit P27 family [Listeria booriae]|uniref:Phage terminase small subunit P27 family n=1 Tax=Listeria booriae TaxID=1552123 RepID=A0A7X0XD93_9LIST|nr:phage terminase small subunit P27 family [Listeria booriae]MBC1491937.1 phage terminase small subunit P27 family [Listeria booriae]
MAGRKPVISTSVKGHRTKVEMKKKREMEQNLSTFSPLKSKPPDWLNEAGKKEYKRISKLLRELPIAELDSTMIAMYANNYSRYIEANESLNKYGIFSVEESEEMRVEQDGVVTVIERVVSRRKNPAYAIMIETGKEIRAMAGSLGMTIDSRMRLNIPKVDKKKSLFDMFGDDDDDGDDE